MPGVACTPTKKGTGWDTCELYPPEEVRARITRDVETALKNRSLPAPFLLPSPVEVKMEFAWSGFADRLAKIPGVRRGGRAHRLVAHHRFAGRLFLAGPGVASLLTEGRRDRHGLNGSSRWPTPRRRDRRPTVP